MGFLTFREKFLVLSSVLVRSGLVALDLAGIFLVGVVVSLVSGTIIAPTSPLFAVLGWLREQGFQNGYAVILGFAIGFFVLKGVLSFAVTFVTANYVGRIEARKARQAFQGIFKGEMGDIGSLGRQEILHGLTNSMNSAFGQTINVTAAIAGEVALLIGVSIYLAIVNFALFIFVAIFFSAVGFLMQASVGNLTGVFAKRQHESLMRSQVTILDSVSNFKQLAIGDSTAFVDAFSFDRSKSARSTAVYSTLGTLPRYITEIAVMVGVGLLVLQRGSASSSITASTIAVFLAGIFRIVASMLPLQSGLSYFKSLKYDSELGFQMVERFAQKTESSNTAAYETGVPPIVRVREVDFTYQGRSEKVISRATFEIRSGSYCAVVGSSGAGKSTLVDLILGLYKPDAGQVEIDGQTPRRFIETYPDAVGYVPQTTTLISGSLLENITMQPRVAKFDQARLEFALRMANIEELVQELPEGLKSVLGPDGVSLSGGQAQRVGLARALYKKPRLLILDEATSALDDASESAIRDALQSLRGKVTIIVIAHRTSTLKSADQVLSVKSRRVASFHSYKAYTAT
jgi:ABC-type multidrug transport system fused ATPase/permease subunit